jgi:phospholipid/cholesterol/gamma-HCH transport system substrate-binding protein
MRLPKKIRIQLAIFAAVSIIAVLVMGLGYARLPSLLFGLGQYTVTVQLPETGGLYKSARVSYRGVEVGRVVDVHLTDGGVAAVLAISADAQIPSDVDAQVHSRSAVGEQYVELLPRSTAGRALANGDTIPISRTSIPPDIASLLDATNRGLSAIPHDNLKTAVDEGYTAVGGLGPDISRLVKASTGLAIDANNNLNSITSLIDQSKPVLDTQTDTAESIGAWAAHLAAVTQQLKNHDPDVRGVLQNGPAAANEVAQLFDRLQPTLPILLANMTSLADVAVTYHPNIEQLLVLIPQATAMTAGTLVPNASLPPQYRAPYADFNLNLNLPPPCTTGFLPPSQIRSPSLEDAPDRPAGDLYCRVPQDSPFNVRGVRNAPCETRPGKRAPTVVMCESDENYVPLNDGFNWKGDPNATNSGQAIPQLRTQPPPSPQSPGAQPSAQTSQPTGPAPPMDVAFYDTATGTYLGPDGKVYTQTDLAHPANKDKTWQSMLTPPAG